MEGGLADITAANGFFKSKELKPIEGQSPLCGLQLISVGYNEHEVDCFLRSMTAEVSIPITQKDILSAAKKLRTCESATAEEKLQLERNNRDKLLDNGEFYDGHFFRDAEGYVLKQHPSIARLVEEFIKSENTEIAEHNRKVREEWQQYQDRYR